MTFGSQVPSSAHVATEAAWLKLLKLRVVLLLLFPIVFFSCFAQVVVITYCAHRTTRPIDLIFYMMIEYEKRKCLAFFFFPFVARVSVPALITFVISISISPFSLIKEWRSFVSPNNFCPLIWNQVVHLSPCHMIVTASFLVM